MGDLQPELFSFEAASKKMNGIQTIAISAAEVNKILAIEEGHFTDIKAIETSPAGLTKAIAALSNAEGGELFIGVDEKSTAKKRSWRGFPSQESANAHVQVFEQLFPLGSRLQIRLPDQRASARVVLKIQVAKARHQEGVKW